MKSVFICYSHKDDVAFALRIAKCLRRMGHQIFVYDDVTREHREHQESSKTMNEGLISYWPSISLRNATGAGEKRLSTICEKFHEDHNLMKAFFISTWDEVIIDRNQNSIVNSVINKANAYGEGFTYFVLIRTTLLNLIDHRNRYSKNESSKIISIIQQKNNQQVPDFNSDETKYTWSDESPFYWKRICSESIKLSRFGSIASQAELFSVVLNYALIINLIVSLRILRDKGGQAMP